ncbi:MAG TPA: beta-ketoacyl-ACP synthase III [Candidatus Kapabacteria bacterium]|nr:beta-ketoacyl-ACP synthase III [Candidatus Kapabacteria bacterium]
MSKQILRAGITAIAHYVPDEVLPNSFFESYLDTSDEWIRTRAGIKERRIMRNGPTSELAVPAIKKVLEQRGITADDIDIILVGTVTPDMFFPSTACVIQQKIGAKNAWGFDVSAACSGFIFTLEAGRRFIESRAAKRVLVVGADKMSAITDYEDRNTCILFGDGAGVVLLEAVDEEYGIIDSILRVDGSGGEHLHMKAGGSLNPPSQETVDNKWHYVYQDGKTVFKSAVIGMAEVSAEIVERNGLTADDIAYLVPHQANLRIIDAARDRMGLPPEKVMVNIDRYGNTTAATIPICLSEWYSSGKLKKGDYVVLASFGAGYTWGATLVRWCI